MQQLDSNEEGVTVQDEPGSLTLDADKPGTNELLLECCWFSSQKS